MFGRSDTHPEVERRHVELLRRAGFERRAEIMRSLSRTVIELSRQALAAQMPGASPDDVAVRWVELTYGAALADGVRRALAARHG